MSCRFPREPVSVDRFSFDEPTDELARGIGVVAFFYVSMDQREGRLFINVERRNRIIGFRCFWFFLERKDFALVINLSYTCLLERFYSLFLMGGDAISIYGIIKKRRSRPERNRRGCPPREP